MKVIIIFCVLISLLILIYVLTSTTRIENFREGHNYNKKHKKPNKKNCDIKKTKPVYYPSTHPPIYKKIKKRRRPSCKKKPKVPACKKKPPIEKCEKYKPNKCDIKNPKCPPPIKVGCEKSIECPVPTNGENCDNCLCPNYPDMSQYILKSKFPNMSEYQLKSEKTEETTTLDMSKFVKKSKLLTAYRRQLINFTK